MGVAIKGVAVNACSLLKSSWLILPLLSEKYQGKVREFSFSVATMSLLSVILLSSVFLTLLSVSLVLISRKAVDFTVMHYDIIFSCSFNRSFKLLCSPCRETCDRKCACPHMC